MNNRDKKRYIIFILAVRKDFRKAGVGTNLLNAFRDKINQSFCKKRIEIVLHSLESSSGFYKKYGFQRINTNKFIENYEGHKSDKKYYMYRFVVNESFIV